MSARPRRRSAFACGIVSALLVAGLPVVTPASVESTSQHFRVVASTLDSAPVAAAGAATRTQGSLGQEGTVGASSSSHFIVQSGFWSFLGSTVVPVLLSVARNGSIPHEIDLSWSGNNSLYLLYRSTTCSAIYDGSALALTSNNSYSDAAPPEAPLVCYNVVAEAPGP